ncbi:MAG: methyl-accepting chemotaxis protein [Thermodesulfobacteriota bacterium]
MRTPTIKATLIGFAVLAVLVLTVPAVLTVAGLSDISTSVSVAIKESKIGSEAIATQSALAETGSGLKEYLEVGGSGSLNRYRQGVEKTKAAFSELIRSLSEKKDQESRVREAEALFVQWINSVADPAVASRGRAGDSSDTGGQGSRLSKGLLDPPVQVQTILLSLADGQTRLTTSRLATMAEWLNRVRTPMYVGIPVYAVLLLIACFVLARRIAKPIADAAGFSEALRLGELSRRLEVQGLDEAQRLAQSLNETGESLARHNSRILEGVEILTASVAQIAGTASELYAGAAQTASAVSETTAIVNEMEQTAKVVNETARRVAEQAEQSDEIANAGTRATGDTLEKMNIIREKMEIVSTSVVELSKNAKHVEVIVAAVQDIADQSNLLAVNASIEAARAGDHGKGFAVVAHEIKSLADQSREATQNITRILQEIRKSVDSVVMAAEEGGKAVMRGVEESESARESIARLADSIAQSFQGANVIFTSSERQFARVERVAAAMRNVELAMNNSLEGTTHLENEAKRLEQLALSLDGLVRQQRGQEMAA